MECPKCSQKVLRSQLVKNYNTNLLENILTAAEETGYTTSNLNLITIARQVIGLEKVSDNFIVLFFYLLSVQEVCATRIFELNNKCISSIIIKIKHMFFGIHKNIPHVLIYLICRRSEVRMIVKIENVDCS